MRSYIFTPLSVDLADHHAEVHELRCYTGAHRSVGRRLWCACSRLRRLCVHIGHWVCRLLISALTRMKNRRIDPYYIFPTAYLLIAAFLWYMEGWSLVDVLYFSVSVFTTVGFGDFAPTSVASKLVTITIIFVSILGLATLSERFVTGVLSKTIRVLHTDEQKVKQQEEIYQKMRRKRLLRALSIFSAFLLVNACMAKYCIGVSWFDAFYFSVITATTVGFGDLVPRTQRAKLCISLTMLVGIPLFGRAVSTLVEYIWGRRRSRMHQVKELDERVLDSLKDFCAYMRENKVYDEDIDQQGKIDKFEFTCWVLVRSHILEVSDIKTIMDNFSELDSSGDQEIDKEDIRMLQQKRRAEQPGLDKDDIRIHQPGISAEDDIRPGISPEDQTRAEKAY